MIRLVLFLAALAALPAFARPGHYLVVHEAANGALSVTYKADVEMADTPQLAATTDWNGNGNRREKRLSVRIAAGDQVLFETDVAAADEVRGEFTGAAGGPIDGHHLPRAEHDYVLRLPAFPIATRALLYPPRVLRPSGAGFAPPPPPSAGPPALLEIPLDALAPGKALTKAASADTFAITKNGSPANRVDILVIAEGYTADQRAQFVQDATNAANAFASISPYREYSGLLNFTGLFLASNQSGSSKPDCPETPGAPVIAVDTALKSHYCTNGIRRLLTTDYNLTLSAAAAWPDWDEIIVVVNDTEYGGSGGAFTVMSMHPSAPQIVQHEFGHTFTRLADEYSTAYPGYPACSDTPGSTSPCEPNVSDVSSPLKWIGWVTPGTSIPTTDVPSDARAAGAWQGARYMDTGIYRQCYNGIMRQLGQPFCKVDSEAFVLRLYSGGWGVPAKGVMNVEPGTAAPDPATTVQAAAGTQVSFSATLAGPSSGLDTVWRVNGTTAKEERIASGGVASFGFTLPQGSATVELDVIDDSGFLLARRSSSTVWQVQGNAAPSDALTITRGGSGGGTVTSSPAGINCGASCAASFPDGTLVSLTATPDAGSSFTGWSGACAGTGVCAVTIQAATSVGATFDTAAAPPGKVDLQPGSLAFGTESMHTTSPSQRVTFTNTGGQPLDVTGMTASAGFAVSQTCGTLAPGASCTADVTFTPGAAGSVSGDLAITTSNGTIHVALSGTGEQSLVTHYYRSILGRAPDAAGHDFWQSEATRVAGLGANVNEAWFAMAMSFFSSAEYTSFGRDDTSYISDLYETFFNRAADADGTRYWKGQVSGGMPRESVLLQFLFSPEFANFTRGIFGDTAVRPEMDMTMDMYRGILQRLPDNAGFNFYLGQFRDAQCKGADAVRQEADSVSQQFFSSSEYANLHRTNAQFMSDIYNAIMRRGADLDGIRFWIGQLDSGAATREQVRQAFVASPEFSARVNAVIAAGCTN